MNQRNIRRLLAYVGVARVGVGLVGVLFGAVGSALALAGCYAIMVICGPESPDLRDYWGLGRQQLLLALGFAFCLASLAGLSSTAGFVGRFYVLTAALETGRVALALAVEGCFPLLAYACFRVIGSVFASAPSAVPPKAHMRAEALVVLLLSVFRYAVVGIIASSSFKGRKGNRGHGDLAHGIREKER